MANMGTYHGTEIPVGSTQDEIRAIIRRVDAERAGGSVDTSLPSLNDVETAETTLPDTGQTDKPGMDFTDLNLALDDAVDLARRSRQDRELDFLNGVIPEGAVSASKFTGLLKNLNTAGDRRSESVLDIVKQQQENMKEERNSLNELGLALIDAGASSESIKGLLQAGSVEAALPIAAGIMDGVTKDDIVVENVGGNLVSYNPENPSETLNILYEGGGTGGGNSSSIKGAVFTDSDTGKTYDLGTVSGIQQYKADNPEITDAELIAFLDSKVPSLNIGTIEDLVKQGGGGAQPLSQEQIKAKVVEVLTPNKDMYKRSEARTAAITQLKKSMGYKDSQSLPAAYLSAIEDALVEVYGATWGQNIIPGGRGNFPFTPE